MEAAIELPQPLQEQLGWSKCSLHTNPTGVTQQQGGAARRNGALRFSVSAPWMVRISVFAHARGSGGFCTHAPGTVPCTMKHSCLSCTLPLLMEAPIPRPGEMTFFIPSGKSLPHYVFSLKATCIAMCHELLSARIARDRAQPWNNSMQSRGLATLWMQPWKWLDLFFFQCIYFNGAFGFGVVTGPLNQNPECARADSIITAGVQLLSVVHAISSRSTTLAAQIPATSTT